MFVSLTTGDLASAVTLDLIPKWLKRLLYILSRWFCYCYFNPYCCSHCLCGFVLDPCFVLQYSVSFLNMQSSR